MLQKFRSKGILNHNYTFLQVILVLTMMLFLVMSSKKEVSFEPNVTRYIRKMDLPINASYLRDTRFY